MKRPAPRRGRILVSLLALLFAVGVVPLLWTSYKLVTRSLEMLELGQKTSQLDKARSLSQQVAVYVASLRSQITAIARTLEVDIAPGRFADRVARIRESKTLERFMGGNSALYSVSIVDAAGAAEGKEIRGTRSGVHFSEPAIERLLQEGVLRALQGKSFVSHPVVSLSVQEPVMILAEPINPPEGGVQGVVLAVANLGPLWKMTEDTGQGGLVDVYVVDNRGRLVAHSDKSKFEEDLDLSQVKIVQMFMTSKGRASSTEPFEMETKDGIVKMLGTYTAVPDDSGWGVIVQVDESKAYYSALDMGRWAALLVAVVTIGAVVLGSIFARQISRPIQELAGSARRLAGGDYSTRVPVASNNEVGVLSDAFNFMGEEIQKAIEEVRRQAHANKELFIGSIRMLANAIDEKDVYTRGHSERVAYYCAAMARHMGMSEEEVERVHLSGIIHDVGKIGIEDKILRKPAALTEDEYEIMKQHPRKGEHILEAVPALKAMAGDGLMHHENWDGSGYPDGLKAEQIPLLGRIVAVADAFDAMTTDRPYSKAMTFEAALARLRFLAGKKFDASCVDAIERASAAGELTTAKARRAAVVARQPGAAVAR